MGTGHDADEKPQGQVRAPRKQGYQDLLAWQEAMDLVDAVYHVTRDWPSREQFGLTAQVRRAAVAIPSNFAERHGRTGRREFAHHASIAYGSLCELETQLLIAECQGFAQREDTAALFNLAADGRRLTSGLLRSLQAPA
jgi:four helix bundle protein